MVKVRANRNPGTAIEELEVDASPPLIEEGTFDAVFVRAESARVFNTNKLFLHFRIVTPGKAHGTVLYRAYRAKGATVGPRSPHSIRIAKRGELLLTLCRLFGRNVRPDRVSLKCLRGLVLQVTVRTVTSDYRQRPLPPQLFYSVIGDVVGIAAGSASLEQ